jgi:hypothetical protein
VCHDEIRHRQNLELVSSDSSIGGEAPHLHTASEVAGLKQSSSPVTELHTEVSRSIDFAPRGLLQRHVRLTDI